MSKRLLTTQEAAEELAIGKTKLYELIRSNAIPTIRIGRAVRIPSDALRDWVAQQLGTKYPEGGQVL